ncbi:MAG: M28 family peptidase [Pirellulaceae bacterium]|nr:M28 family peptidase [Pirellulaceae bacterium]
MTLTLSSDKRPDLRGSGAQAPETTPRSSIAGAREARTRGPNWFWGLLLVGIGLAVLLLGLWNSGQLAIPRNSRSNLTLERIPFDGQRAYEHLQAICAIGPRVSGTPGMQKQQDLLIAHFEKLGGKVSRQEFAVRHPLDGSRVPMANLIVEWHPERKNRILLCCHYDTRPFPDEDPVNPKGVFVGANDGASGPALMMVLGEKMAALEGPYGVDFVLFDGEELVYDKQRDPYFLGSEHFAREYVANPPPHKYKSGVLVDMIADAQLQIFREVNSMRTLPTRQLVSDIWKVAGDLGVKEFIAQTRYEVRDDHIPLNEIAKIPTIDIIDFSYPHPRAPNYWHTTQDVPANCSALSLAKVGWVLETWLSRLK